MEKLSIPARGIFETEWPFSDLERSVDNLLREKGFKLMHRELLDDREGSVSVNRRYGAPAGSRLKDVFYGKIVETPRRQSDDNIAYGDFEPEEVTEYNGEFIVTPSAFLERLRSVPFQVIYFTLHSRDAVKFTIAAGYSRTIEAEGRSPEEFAEEVSSVTGLSVVSGCETAFELPDTELVPLFARLLDHYSA